MAELKPETGLVFRYDYVFEEEHTRGIDSGKDRPCAIVLAMERDEGGHRILAAPITHTPPARAEDGVEIPYKLAQNLGLDDDRMWVKTNDLNRFTWEEGRIPVGVSPVSQAQPAYGYLPPQFRHELKDSVLEKVREKTLNITERDELLADYRAQPGHSKDDHQMARDHDMADDD